MYKIKLPVRMLVVLTVVTIAGVLRLDSVAQNTTSRKKEEATALATLTNMVAAKDGA